MKFDGVRLFASQTVLFEYFGTGKRRRFVGRLLNPK